MEFFKNFLFYFILWIILYYLFCCSDYLSFALWELFHTGSSVPLTHHHVFCILSTSLLSDTVRCSRLILYSPCPGLRIRQFSWFLLLENDI